MLDLYEFKMVYLHIQPNFSSFTRSNTLQLFLNNIEQIHLDIRMYRLVKQEHHKANSLIHNTANRTALTVHVFQDFCLERCFFLIYFTDYRLPKPLLTASCLLLDIIIMILRYFSKNIHLPFHFQRNTILYCFHLK